MTVGQLVTTGIVLNRVDYAEADRILTWLTPDQGKISLLARAVKRQKSKLAGGIELFSESSISFVRGRGDIGTLTSARLLRHFANIVKDLNRTGAAYDILKLINKTVEARAAGEWYDLLKNSLVSLDDTTIPLELIEFWFSLRWLKLSGRSPNLRTTAAGVPLDKSKTYAFNLEQMAFYPKEQGSYRANHVKFLRLGISAGNPLFLAKVRSLSGILEACHQLSQTMQQQFL